MLVNGDKVFSHLVGLVGQLSDIGGTSGDSVLGRVIKVLEERDCEWLGEKKVSNGAVRMGFYLLGIKRGIFFTIY